MTAASLTERVLEALPVGVVVWRLVDAEDDASLELQLANSAAGRFLGRDLRSKVGQRFSDVFPSVGVERRALYAGVARTGAPYEDVVVSTVSGSAATYSVAASAIGDRCVAIHFENLSQQARAEREAREVGAFLDSIIENLPNMLFVKEAEDLRFERFNKAGEELLGIERTALLGKNDYDFFPKEQADFFVAADRETLTSGQIRDIPEEPIDTARGQRWLHTRKVPLCDVDGRPRYLLGISEDITEQRRGQRALEAAKDAALAANKELEAFSYSVAHDLRSPLRAIDGFSQILLDEHAAAFSGEPREFLDRIQKAARRMAELIDDLLELSRMAQAPVRRERVDISAMSQRVVEQLRASHPERVIEAKIGSDLYADADAGLVRIALENLLGNAVKFSANHPSVRIEIGSERLDGAATFFVRDHGAGFDMAHVQKLFRPFERLHTGEFSGSGIGLAIVARVVTRHGGRISAEGVVDGGATFRFTLGEP